MALKYPAVAILFCANRFLTGWTWRLAIDTLEELTSSHYSLISEAQL